MGPFLVRDEFFSSPLFCPVRETFLQMIRYDWHDSFLLGGALRHCSWPMWSSVSAQNSSGDARFSAERPPMLFAGPTYLLRQASRFYPGAFLYLVYWTNMMDGYGRLAGYDCQDHPDRKRVLHYQPSATAPACWER
jgi:hypothetical protein